MGEHGFRRPGPEQLDIIDVAVSAIIVCMRPDTLRPGMARPTRPVSRRVELINASRPRRTTRVETSRSPVGHEVRLVEYTWMWSRPCEYSSH